MLLEDPGIASIFTAFVLDACLFLLFLLGFVVLKRCRSKSLESADDLYTPRSTVYSEHDTPLWTLVRKVLATSLPEVSRHCGHQTFLYLSVLKYTGIVLSVMSFYGLTVLVPVYLRGHEAEPNELEKMGISHILHEESLMLSPLVFFVFFSALGYVLVYKTMRLSEPADLLVIFT